MMDTFRIKALQKHLSSKYNMEVKNELIKKIDILINGAKKYNNQEVINLYMHLKETIL
jgi:hypothetical protein